MSQRDPSNSANFDIEGVFDEDYLYFYQPILPAERSGREADAIWELLSLEANQSVLDIGCGHGRISNALAERDLKVTGIDITPHFLEKARADAQCRGLCVDYIAGDMRSLPWRDQFDAAYIWFTTFGYFDDGENCRVLAAAADALKSSGRLLLEQVNRAALLKRGLPHWDVCEVNDDLLIDRVDYDGLLDCSLTVRTTVRSGYVKRTNFSVRLYSPTELTTRLKDAGFSNVEIFGQHGKPFELYGNRLIAVATK